MIAYHHGMFELIDLLLVALILIPLGDVIASGFFLRLFFRSQSADQFPGAERPFLSRVIGGRSWLLLMLAIDAIATAIVTGWIGYVAALRLYDLPVPEHATEAVAFALIVLGSVPIAFMVVFLRSRR